MAFCEVCLNDASLVCSECKLTRYCSPACQRIDWKIHKKACKFNQIINEFEKKTASTPPKRPKAGRCTGCSLKFDEEENFCEDECEKCGYQVCESCVSHTSNGTCYCLNENFGRPYCLMSPRWWHNNGRGKSYNGDRHPEIGDEFLEEAFEPEARKCTNCGKTERMLKKEYC